jgi:D-alanyl-D-alanine carboxypeptidase/VanZ family protein
MFYIVENEMYLLVGAFVIGVWLTIQELVCCMTGKRMRGTSILLRWLMGVYLTFLFALTISPVYGWSFPHIRASINLIPFHVFATLPDGMRNFLGNILMFIPMGVLLYTLTGNRRKPWPVLWGTTVSCLIEVLQLFTTRSTDVDDVLLNTTGTLLGWLLGNVFHALVSPGRKEKPFLRKQPLRTSKIGSLICLSLAVVMTVGFYENSAKQETFPEIKKPIRATRFHDAQSAENNSISVAASNGILICTDTNELLWKKESQKSVAPASCAKLLNALTVLKYCDPDEAFTVGNEVNMIAADASRSYLSKGTRLTVRQAMIAMLLPSGNDAAYALAVYAGRQIASDNNLGIDEALKRFEDEMNTVAKKLGAIHSNFCSPDGYDKDEQYTTAYDLALIGKASMENGLIARIVKMAHSRETWLSGETAKYDNTNEMLIPGSPCYLSDCTGLKTGTSTKAGACLVMSFTVKKMHYIGVVMGSTKKMRFQDGLQLYDMIPNHGESNHTSQPERADNQNDTVQTRDRND